ncbi:MAG: major facilitator superfamily 1 [Burkholderiaceae bacterium]|nr:major facilitator superfamily 1 [Burkholderiaceae bacterium]
MTTNTTPYQPRKAIVLTIILVSYLMLLLDISIVITGLPKIEQELNFTTTELTWVQSLYTLTFGGFLLLAARAGDIFGRRRMFVMGLTVFILASVLIGWTQSAEWMLSARAVQGMGAAILAPSTLALMSTNFAEGEERTRAVSYYGATAGVGASIGLVLGGIFADWLSWRVGFFINLPVGLALMYGALRYLKETEKQTGQLDVMGALTSTIGMGSLIYGIVRAASQGWGNALTVTALLLGVVFLAVFVWNESRAEQPIMPLRLFANRERVGAYVARLLFLGSMVGFWFFTTHFLQGVLGYTPFEAGLAFLPTTVVNFAAALMVTRLTTVMGGGAVGNGRLLFVGLSITLLGMGWLAQVSANTHYISGVALPMVLLGVGQGWTLSPLTVAGIAGVSEQDAGAASGVVNAFHQLGASLGLSILAVVFAHSYTGTADNVAVLAHRIGNVFLAGAWMLILALVVVWLLIIRTPHTVMD